MERGKSLDRRTTTNDMLRFMSPEAAKAILLDYNTAFRKSITAPYWTRTWFKKHRTKEE
jgi:hypothetical protein